MLGDLRALSRVLRLSPNAYFPFLFAEAGVQTKDRKRKRQALKIGHGGTLDSAATGVLGNEEHKHSHRASMGDTSVPTCGGGGAVWDMCSTRCGFGLLEKSALGYVSLLCTCTVYNRFLNKRVCFKVPDVTNFVGYCTHPLHNIPPRIPPHFLSCL